MRKRRPKRERGFPALHLLETPPWWRGDRLPWDMACQLVSELNKLHLWEERWKPREIKRAVKRGLLDSSIFAVREIVDSLCPNEDEEERDTGEAARARLEAARNLFGQRFAREQMPVRFPAVTEFEEQEHARGRKRKRRAFVNLGPGPILSPLLCLWTILLDARLRLRFRRCPQCGFYFVDATRNRSALRCSKGCTARFWTRPRRRKAGHHS